MIIIIDKATKDIISVMTNSLYPDGDIPNFEVSDEQDVIKIHDNSELAEKIKSAGIFDVILNDNGELVDIVKVPDTPLLPTELRQKAYQTDRCIAWQGSMITVDEAKQQYVNYDAEGSPKADELKVLIATTKAEIRELYPDKV